MPNKNQPQNLPEGWRRARLGEIGEFKTSGVDKKIREKEKIVNLINYMDVYKNHFITKNLDFMKVSANPHQIRTNNVRKGDILFTPSSETPEDIGHSAVVINELNDTLYIYHLVRFRLKNQSIMDLKFRGYIFNSRQILHQFESLATGVTRFTLSKKDFENVYVIYPQNIKEQQKIAEILETVDNAIEKTDKIIEKYKRIKQGLMQDLLTKGIDEKGNIRNPKTHKFKDSPLGKIPEEWEVVRLGEVAELERGKFQHRPRNDPKLYGGKYPFIQTGDISSANKYIKTYKQSLNEKGVKFSKIFEKGTLVITIAANIGDTAILNFDSAFPDSVVAVKKDSKINLEFLHYLFYELKRRLNTIAIESAQKNINLEILSNLLIKLPPLPEQKRIVEILSQIDQTIEKETAYKEKLQHIKKGLMEDLLTGKVRVKV